MTAKVKQSLCAFVVIKLKTSTDDWYLMRRNSVWKDINFIGGHAIDRDSQNLEKTAYRELLEEVPSLRTLKSFSFEPLTDKVEFGPVFSKSAGCRVKYILRFFLVQFKEQPHKLLESLNGRTRNLLVRRRDLISPHKYSISQIVDLLKASLPRGLDSIPYSWKEDLEQALTSFPILFKQQDELL